ncbi:PTS mannose transporter subunit IIA [Nocardioides szechwanensis]|uniref:Mannitol-specific phosphotransferase enzyme IIA component n=1 Tax=Nocardioides szechwanensis TaxID=1005944 RepID=A0A1G9V5H2_9ACTN|nr:PTS mannitol transporter subunit IICBA [Nocardioides szechwanensis]GEP33039.1 PTS mannose transporter subunit IIA [Nocardioides szechwanensis]SDM67115.1 PTS system D-mannitol-specific IIA component, Fru family /PTS system D-mannitol-specific IIB component, Fru family /PTS system D-mannitol-specific IIC component, Fru family [Nocardioides szechwanensis]
MVLPNIGAFIAWGLITALFIEVGWITLIGDKIFGYEGGYGFVEDLGAWGSGADQPGIVGPMITYLLPILIGFTGGRMMYDGDVRGGVVGAIATTGAITGTDVPMFLGAMIMGPLGGWSMKKIDALWDGKIKPGFEMLVNNFSAGIWGMILAIFGFLVAGPFVKAFSNVAEDVVDFLVDNSLLPLTSIFVEPAKILFLNNAINHGVFTPLGTTEAVEDGKSILFLIEANPGPGLGLLLAFAVFGTGIARASAPGAMLIQFVGGIHEIYFPFVLMKPKLILAVIAGGMTGVLTNVIFDSGLRAPAAPGSIIAVWLQVPADSFIGVTLSVVSSATVTFLVAAFLLRMDRDSDEGDLAAAAASMESMKGKKSSVAGSLGATSTPSGRISSIVFACDAGMGSSAMGASVLRKKIHGAGFPEVTVVNKAISNLTDTYDLVVTHQDLTTRAKQKTGSAIHVSVDNFMNSPRYDEIVELVEKANGAGGSVPATADSDDPGVGVLLDPESIVLDVPVEDRAAAITRAGHLLLNAGAVDAAYVDAMHDREASVSTFMGNGLAIPHGTNEAKSSVRRTAISFVRYTDAVDWKNKPVKFVVGIAALGDDHLKLLGRIAEVFLDDAQVARLEAARTPEEILQVLGAVQPV